MTPPPSSSPLSAAPWLELFESPHGLGLRATRDAPAGTALLTERPLAAAVVAASNRSRSCSRPRRRCRRCLSLLSLRPPTRVRTCSGCRNAASSSYCDSECEEEDQDAHRSSGECELLRRVEEEGEGEVDKRQQGEATATAAATTAETTPFLREACLALRLLRARPPSAGPLVTHSDELMSGEGRRGRRRRAAAELAAKSPRQRSSPPRGEATVTTTLRFLLLLLHRRLFPPSRPSLERSPLLCALPSLTRSSSASATRTRLTMISRSEK